MEHRCPEALGGHGHCHLDSLQLEETRLPGQALSPLPGSRRLGAQAGRTPAPILGSSLRGSCQVGKRVQTNEHAESPCPHTPGLACRAAPPAAGDRLPAATVAPPAGQGRSEHGAPRPPRPGPTLGLLRRPEASRRVSCVPGPAEVPFPKCSSGNAPPAQGRSERRSWACWPCNSAQTLWTQAGVRLAACSLQHPLASTNRG